MAGILSEQFCPDTFYDGRRYRTNAAYDIVLMLQRMYKDKDISDMDKLTLALENLAGNPYLGKPIEWRSGLLQAIVARQIELPSGPVSRKQPKQRLVDFELDGEYIFASFYQEYGIDLLAEQGHLHWKKFIWLFRGLSDKTPIKEIMRIRDMDLPEPTKHNRKQIQRIMEQKSYYALPVEGGGGQEGLNRLFATLERMAIR